MLQGTSEKFRTDLCSHWCSFQGSSFPRCCSLRPSECPWVLRECHLLLRISQPRKVQWKGHLCPQGRNCCWHTFWGTGLGSSGCIHPKGSECVHSSHLKSGYSQETRYCYEFSLVEKKCCARSTVLFRKHLRKYFVLILALTGQQSDYTNLFYQEARQER